MNYFHNKKRVINLAYFKAPAVIYRNVCNSMQKHGFNIKMEFVSQYWAGLMFNLYPLSIWCRIHSVFKLFSIIFNWIKKIWNDAKMLNKFLRITCLRYIYYSVIQPHIKHHTFLSKHRTVSSNRKKNRFKSIRSHWHLKVWRKK